jgi:glycosyltransferase involved in cell wall biosynthesis
MPYWTNKQHTAVHLAGRGHRVLYVESPGMRAPRLAGMDVRRIAGRVRRGLSPIRQVRENVWVLSPLLLPAMHHLPLAGRLNQAALRSALKRFVARLGFARPLVWTYHAYMLDTLRGWEHGPVVYHCVDDLAAVPGVDAEGYARAERALLEKADVVFTTSTSLNDKCRRHNARSHYFPNVADYEHFARAHADAPLPQDLQAIRAPRIGYVGVLSDFKIDFTLLLQAARMRPEWSWVFIGDEREGQRSPLVEALRALPNVHLLGHRSYAVLPDYLRGMAAGLIPALVNDYTRAMFPMKYFEYLAAGLPVVATPLDFARDMPACRTAPDATALVHALEEAIAGGRLTQEQSRDAVGVNTWLARLDAMLDLVARAA